MKLTNSIPLTVVSPHEKALIHSLAKTFSHIVISGEYVLGKSVELFESKFAKYTGAKYCIGVASGTDGLLLSLKALNIGAGDEVITVSNTFIATALAITYAGAKPVFIDIDESTYNMDPDLIEHAITKKTKAIMPVCLYGQPPNLSRIQSIARKHNLKLIIDACQAHGSLWKGKPMGIWGDTVVYSFYPTKNLGAIGDGGIVTTNQAYINERLKILRNVGRDGWYDHVVKGYNSRLDALQASILLQKLPYLRKWNNKRIKLVKRYNTLLSKTELNLPKTLADARSVYYLYVVRTKKRNGLQKFLTKYGIQTAIHYPIPIHLQTAYKELNLRKGYLPITEKVMEEILSLPLYPHMTYKEQNAVVNAVKKFFEKN